MAKQRNDAPLWLRQAADDYRFGRLALRNQFHAQACFIAQQAAEKAVKDALPGITPSDAFSEAQARTALRAARRILSWAQAHLRTK